MKKLYLSEDKKLSGLCGGLGEYFDIDPSVIRLLWVIVTVMTGIIPGVIAYFVAAWAVPERPRGEPAKDS